MRFGFDRSTLKPPYEQSAGQVAALLADPRCVSEKAEVAGHADYVGPRLYNQALSERRAQKVANLLAARGIDPNRLVVRGFGEDAPLDMGKNRTARAKNRRVTVTIVKEEQP